MKNLILMSLSIILILAVFIQAEESKTLPDLSWLEGHWVGDGFGGVCEESWMPLSGGTMVGTFKLVVLDKVSFYEIMTLVPSKNGGYDLNVKHFNPDMTGWEEKGDVVTFTFIECTANKLLLNGLSYERTADDSLVIKVTINDRDGEIDEVIIHSIKKQ